MLILPSYNWNGTQKLGNDQGQTLYISISDDGYPTVFYDSKGQFTADEATHTLRFVGLLPTPYTNGWYKDKQTHISGCLCPNPNCTGTCVLYWNGEVCYEQTLLVYAEGHGCPHSLDALARLLISRITEDSYLGLYIKAIEVKFPIPIDFDQGKLKNLLNGVYPVIKRIISQEQTPGARSRHSTLN